MATTVSRVIERSRTSKSDHIEHPGDTRVDADATGNEPVTDAATTDDEDASAVDVPDTGGGGDEPAGPSDLAEVERPLRRRFTALLLGCLAVVIAASVTGTVYIDRHTEAVSDTDRNTEIVDTAEQVVKNLVTLRHDTADADVRRIEDSTTGDFQKQFTDATGSFATVLTQGEVDSTGEATDAALVSADDKTATVIAAVTSTVKNTEAPDGQQRVYRMKLTMENIKGRWLASNVEFVS